MHEYSVASSLLRMAEAHAREHEARRVVRLGLRIGEQAGIEVELLETAWSLVCAGSLCEGASLEIRRVPLRWECPRCGGEIDSAQGLVCSPCGRPGRLSQGAELLLERIEMEVA